MNRKLNLRYSKDGGHNDSPWRILDMGDTGSFVHTLVENRFGQGEEWVFETQVDGNVRCDILAVSWNAEVQG